MSDTTERQTVDPVRSPFSAFVRIWIGVGIATWAVTLALTTDPPLTGAATLGWIALAVVVLVAMTVSLAEPLRPNHSRQAMVGLVVALAGWSVLMFRDDRWSILTFALYAMCFAKGRLRGVVLAAVVSTVWLAAWIEADGPSWRLLIPFATFAGGAIISIAIHQVGDENHAQAALIAQLEATRDELAASERERGTLEERERFAGEIHDTLAQGFTSIVLLSRATRRNREWESGLAHIEATAEDNLAAARRLVAAMRPAELDHDSLTEALERQVDSFDADIDATFMVSGPPVSLAAPVEDALLRTAQEALLNIRTHAYASAVHVTLSYLGSTVVLDVADDGIGFTPNTVTDRGSLTGGQGLTGLRHRAATLGGSFDIETGADGGTVVSMQLPTRSP